MESINHMVLKTELDRPVEPGIGAVIGPIWLSDMLNNRTDEPVKTVENR